MVFERRKNLKGDLKGWNKEAFEDINRNKENIILEIKQLY